MAVKMPTSSIAGLLRFTQIGDLGFKIDHLATLAATTPARPLTMRKKQLSGKTGQICTNAKRAALFCNMFSEYFPKMTDHI
jgi:hypothetical protein